jgi:hypothetical protein
MRRAIVTAAVLALAAALVAVGVLLLGVDRSDYVFDAYLVFLAGVMALTVARLVARRFPVPAGVVPRILARRARTIPLPESLQRMEDVVLLAESDEFDTHYRLRPLLQEIAAAGLATRSGVDLFADSDRARAELSGRAWALLRPDRRRPQGIGSPGIDPAELAATVDELERLLPP